MTPSCTPPARCATAASASPARTCSGSHAATDFVNWYCGHPDVDSGAFTLDAESVAVIGVGNVAVDVARILARDPAELEQTDIPEPVMDALRASKVREVHVIGRRGPAQAKFTTKELRELGELGGVHVSADPAELDLAGGFDRSGESAALATSDRRVRGNLVAMAGWDGAARRAGQAAQAAAPLLAAPGGNPRVVIRERWRAFASSAPALTRAGHSRARASSRPSTRSWCCAAWATSPSRCPASRSTPRTYTVPERQRPGPVARTASRSPASTSPAG